MPKSCPKCGTLMKHLLQTLSKPPMVICTSCGYREECIPCRRR